MNTDQISLQLYTLRERTARDMLGTLRAVAEMGYRAVELAGYGGVPVADVRPALDEYGLRAVSSHVPLRDWDSGAQQVFSDLHALGCAHAVVPIAPDGYREDEEAVARLAQRLNRLGESCRSEGLRFSYHNHDFEFARVGSATLLDVLVRETDPRLVGLELDVYWARYAGVDPAALIRNLANRISLLHLKDMTPERSDAPVGEGTLPWPDLLQAGDDAGVEYYIVEQDHPENALEDVRTSLRNLEALADDG
jgi:sugar phosphate isomerase/epimerase